MTRKKILFIASRFPYPASSGRERTLLEYLEFLKDEADVFFCYMDTKRVSKSREKELTKKFKLRECSFLPVPPLKYSIPRLLYNSFLTGSKSLQENIFFSRNNVRTLLKKAAEADVVFADMLRTAQYLQHLPGSHMKVFDMDDVISKRYRYLLSNKEANILGYYGEKLPKPVRTLANTLLRNLLLKKEASLIEKRERILTASSDRTLLVSPLEEKFLQNELPEHASKIHSILPAGNLFEDLPEPSEKKQFAISFIGLLNVPHNEKGLLHFFEHIFPILLEKLPQTEIFVIGKNPTERLLSYAKLYESRVHFTGFVDDPSRLILSTRLLIAPVYFGTGIKIKILDAMSLGMPVVTTPVGAEGLPVRNGTELLIADNDEDFARHIHSLLLDEELCKRIGSNAKAYISQYHDREKLKRKFLNLLEVNHGENTQ